MRDSDVLDGESALEVDSAKSAPEKLTTALAATALLTACGGGGEGGGPSIPGNGSSTPGSPAGATYTAALNDEDAVRFLLQAQVSASLLPNFPTFYTIKFFLKTDGILP